MELSYFKVERPLLSPLLPINNNSTTFRAALSSDRDELKTILQMAFLHPGRGTNALPFQGKPDVGHLNRARRARAYLSIHQTFFALGVGPERANLGLVSCV